MRTSFRNAVRLYGTKRYELALEELEGLTQGVGTYPELPYYQGLCLTQLERYEEALIYLEQVVTTDSNLLHIYQSRMILSYIYTITKRYKLAEFELESLLNSGYESAQVHAAFGYVAFACGEKDAAINCLKKALALDPENANAMNSLGFVLADEEQDLNYALSLCRRAVLKSPENPAYLDSLGWVYLKLGNVTAARHQLRRAMNIAGKNREIAKHMREALNAEE